MWTVPYTSSFTFLITTLKLLKYFNLKYLLPKLLFCQFKLTNLPCLQRLIQLNEFVRPKYPTNQSRRHLKLTKNHRRFVYNQLISPCNSSSFPFVDLLLVGNVRGVSPICRVAPFWWFMRARFPFLAYGVTRIFTSASRPTLFQLNICDTSLQSVGMQVSGTLTFGQVGKRICIKEIETFLTIRRLRVM